MLRVLLGWPAVMVVLAGVGASPAVAQSGEWLALGVSSAWSEIGMTGFEDDELALSGFLYGGEMRASWWWLDGRAEYRQGRLDQDGSGTERVTMARGSVGVRPVPWLVALGGPVFWTVGTDAGDERILRWSVGLRAEGPLIERWVTGFADLRGSVAGTRMIYDGLPGGMGDVGLLLRIPDQPFWVSFGYRLEREVFPSDSLHTAETVHLAVGLYAPAIGAR